MIRFTFILSFVLGPLLAFGLIPSILFGFLTGYVGTNLIWGSVFGSGFWLACVALRATHSLDLVLVSGLIWAFLLVPPALYFSSDWLWRRLDERGRKIALGVLLASFLLDVPLNYLALHGPFLPDWALFLDGLD